MCRTVMHLLILMTLSCLSCAEDEAKVTVSCPEYQKAFGGSCYEFVGLQHTFFSAQAWCEQRGGHLAFIPDEETQYFLQRHLDPKKDVWLGAAPSTSSNLQYSPTVEGPLSWLDGSHIIYSSWVSRPQPGAACGHILRDSGFQWDATRDCNKKLSFICQFESGRSIVCAGRNTTLQCGSGQVLMIDGGFYGRKNIHYCRSTLSPPKAPTPHQCGWVDVVESFTAHCHGRQVCQIAEIVDSFGEPCPQLGSYLSLDYHCKDGLTLSVSTVAAVFDDVTISVKWLLNLPQGNLICKLSTGDDHVTYLHRPEGLESIVVHKYTHPGTFVVAVECTGSGIHVTAQKIIAIQEPIREFGVITCYSGKLYFHANNCKSLYGEQFQIQMEVKAGTNVTYRIQSNEMLLSGSSVVRGNVPQNITVTSEMVKQLGPGCHRLTLYASNMVTFPEVSADLQMCVLEKVAGLQASLLTERDDGLDSPCITVGVSLERGGPVLLLFSLTGDNSSFSESRKMNTRKDIFRIGHQIQELSAITYYKTYSIKTSSSVPTTKNPTGSTTASSGTTTTASSGTTTTASSGTTTTAPSGTTTTTASSGTTTTTAPSGTTTTTASSGTTTTAPSGTTTTTASSGTTTTTAPSGTTTATASSGTTTTTAPSGTTTATASSGTTTTTAPSGTTTTTASSGTTTTTAPSGTTTTTAPSGTTTTTAPSGTTTTTAPSGTTTTTAPSGTTTTTAPSGTTTTTAPSGTTTTTAPSGTTTTTASSGTTTTTAPSDTTSATTTSRTTASTSETSSPATTNNDDGLQCNISPQSGTILDIFKITCNTEVTCSNCQYCFKTHEVSLYLFLRVTPGSLHSNAINIPNSSSPTFSLPTLPPDILSSDEPVDVRMLSLDKNPFTWKERGNISGMVGSLALTTTDGSSILVENLSEDIEILLPRPVGQQVNTSFLDLGNYSTIVIDLSSVDNTLVLKDPLPFKLFLGYLDYPNDTNYVAMTEMPHQGTTQEERYTWLLEPKDLKGNTGLHYLVVRPIVGPGIKSIDATLSVTSITTACTFWDESKLDWSEYGCRVGVQTTHLVTQCLCNHLTFFGSSFFVTPNLVDPSRTAELFGTFAENPVVVCFVGALFVAYLLVVLWARRKDIQDVAKVKVTVLEDNDPMDDYRYLLSVSTGYRRGASTSSQVTITLLGAEGNSEPHHLTDPKKCLFERGAVDMFLLTAPFSLGDLQGIRLWHNNSGSHPAWYVGNVMVQDLQTEHKWHFLCNSWLAIDVGDCSLDKVFPVSTETDLKRFSNLFFMKTTKDFRDGHLWYSVISRPPSSTFTCVQRVSCCFSLLLCTMLTSIMFYGIPTDPSEQTMDLGHFEFTWQQFMVGVQSSLIMFPVNILIVSIFRNTRPRETSCCKRKTKKTDTLEQTSFSETATTNVNVNVTLETVIKDITRITHSLSKTVKSNIPCTESEFGPGQQVDINAVLSVVDDFIKQNNKTGDSGQTLYTFSEGSASVHPGSTVEGIQKKNNKTQYLYRQLCHIDRELSLLGPSGFPNPHSYSQAVQQVHGMKGILEDQLFKFSSPKRMCCHGGLPWWFILVGWLLVVATSVVAGYFTMLYGLKFGKERSISWLVSMIVSFFQSILVIQPLKVLCLAVFFALVIKKVDEEDFQNVAFAGNDTNLAVRQNNSLYEPPPPADIERMRRNKILEQKAFALLREILTYMGFLWMLLLVAHGQRDPNAFFLKQHIRNSFSGDISDSMSLGDVFTWAKTSLLSNLFGVYPGFITDGNSKLVGNARLRQLRVQKNSCHIAGSMLQFVPDCHAPYSWEVEDMGSYDPGWNHSVRDNDSTSTSSPWKYQTQAELRDHPVWGETVLYRGGGFVAELGPDLQNASSTLEYLFSNKWLDMYTRAIIVEFTVYNANVNLFCIVTLLLETTAVGAFQFNSELQSVRLYISTGGLHIFVMAAEIIYMLFILYYMFLQYKLMKQQKWAYFRSKWNLLDLTIILLSWSAVAVFIQRTLLGNRDMTYYQNHKDQFPSFYETAIADSTLQYLIAFLVLLATVKLWHLLRLNPKMNMITATLQRAWSNISSFLVIIVIMFIAYSIASNVIYGWKMSSYRTLSDALVTIISLQIGIFNYDEVLDCTPMLGGLLFGSCIVFMTLVVLNLLVSVILVAFSEEQIYHKSCQINQKLFSLDCLEKDATVTLPFVMCGQNL
uniref:Polycystic kidney disease protein 1-like 2 n=1 Tax=Dicentrarchus labrax TaxID=13489 RepID=A0A8P4G0C2_DICLA